MIEERGFIKKSIMLIIVFPCVGMYWLILELEKYNDSNFIWYFLWFETSKYVSQEQVSSAYVNVEFI